MAAIHPLHHPALILLVFGASIGQPKQLYGQQVAWVKHYGNPSPQIAGFKLACDGSGNIYGTGSIAAGGLIDFDGNSAPVQGQVDIIVAKWDSTGVNQWVRTVGGVPVLEDWDEGEYINYNPATEQLIVNGTYNSLADFGCVEFTEQNDQRAIFMACYTPEGACEWARTIRGGYVYSRSLLIDANSDLYWFGASVLSSPQFVGFPGVNIPYGGFVARYGVDGILKSARRILNIGGVSSAKWVDTTHWLMSIPALEGSELFGVDLGITESASGVLAMVDTSGTVVWHQTYQGSEGFGNGSAGCAVVGSHAIVVGLFRGEMTFDGETLTSPEDDSRVFLASYDLWSGEPEWIRPFVTEGHVASSQDLQVDEQGTIYFFGEYSDTLTVGPMQALPVGESSSFLARFDTLGNCLSAFYFGPSSGSSGSIALSRNRIVLSAPYAGNVSFGPVTLPSSNSIVLAKLDTLTGYTGVGPSFMALQENLLIYANPNNGLCSVQLPTHLQFTNGLLLSIFDQTGQLVQRVPVTMGNAGVQVDIQAQAKGLYHVELGDGRQRYTGTIVFE